MVRREWIWCVVAIVAWSAGIGLAGAQATEAVLGSIESTADPTVKLEVTELKRVDGGLVQLRYRLVNGASSPCCTSAFAENVYLVDSINKKKYLVVRDSALSSLSGGGLPAMSTLASGQTLNMWARLPAPPDKVQKIGLVYPGFPPLDGLPIAP